MEIKKLHTRFIKNLASEHGFDFCGIAQARRLDEDAKRLEDWLHKGYHGKMGYMENHFDMRVDPSRLVPGAKSVITLLKNYYPSELSSSHFKVSKYAYGNDYHDVIRTELRRMMEKIREKTGEFNGRGFVDSAPVLERTWAKETGLGWIGKNGNLITRQQGSFFFIATLITDLELEYDSAMVKDYCGNCRKCIDACPTDAIKENRQINGSQCISYFTIELKDEIIPYEVKGKFNNWMFGCDICQDVCPWNRFSKPNTEPGFAPIKEVLEFSDKEWKELSEDMFKNIFKQSPLKRSKYKGIQRNIQFLLQSEPDTSPERDPS
jgi:epoxyqueuosine reductase